MKLRPRIRKAVKWGGVVVTVLLVVAWIGSGWWYVGRNEYGRFHPILKWGRVDVLYIRERFIQPHAPVGISFGRLDVFEQRWHFEWEFYGRDVGIVSVPLWSIAAASLAVTMIAWRLDVLARRRALSHCPKCDYDRAGLAAGVVCPECGRLPS